MPRPALPRPVPGLLAGCLLVLLATGPAGASSVPGLLLDTGDAEGAEVTVTPAAVRAPEGRAELDVTLGADAPGDVVITLRLAPADVDDAGRVRAGSGSAPGRVTAGSRLRPGETLRSTVTGVTDPAVLEVTSVAADGGDDRAVVAAVVLPSTAGPAPQVEVAAGDGGLRTTVRSEAPLLVTVALGGDGTVTHPDRLVLPDQPLVLTGPSPRWPLPGEVVVVDEAGRTVRADTGRGPLAVAAGLLLAVAIAAALLARRRHARPPSL